LDHIIKTIRLASRRGVRIGAKGGIFPRHSYLRVSKCENERYYCRDGRM